MFAHTITQFAQTLRQLDHCLGKASAHAKAMDFSEDRYLGFRLAPDMFSLDRQIQAACDSAKLCAARLAGQEAPKHADDETTLEALRSRVRSVASYLADFKADDFAGAGAVKVRLPFLPEGKAFEAESYVRHFAVPNFYFHAAMTYAILRHNGVEVGKRDFIGPIDVVDQ